jgi:hypothetical protein
MYCPLETHNKPSSLYLITRSELPDVHVRPTQPARRRPARVRADERHGPEVHRGNVWSTDQGTYEVGQKAPTGYGLRNSALPAQPRHPPGSRGVQSGTVHK